jgi:hypothetical protein
LLLNLRRKSSLSKSVRSFICKPSAAACITVHGPASHFQLPPPSQSLSHKTLSSDQPEAKMESPAIVSNNLYQPLPDNTVRFLRIAPGKAKDEVCCQLITTDITSSPAFEALSYAWGDDAYMKPISIDGVQYWIRSNLYYCLHHIRLLDTFTTVWADALCINQEDDDEKSIQIKLMPKIYQSATSTLIWLSRDLGRWFPKHRKVCLPAIYRQGCCRLKLL